MPQGSLILFCSYHAGDFYLDTVLVTKDTGVRYSVPISNQPLPFTVSNDYKTVTLNNLTPRLNTRTRPNRLISEFMFYRGKLPSKQSNGCIDQQDIFSFTPARIFNSPNYNERCKINFATLNSRLQNLHDFLQFALVPPRRHKIIIHNATQSDVLTIWREVRNAVINSSFLLGYHFPW